MLLVLTGQLTFGSLDDACTKEQVLHRTCDQIAHCIYTLKVAQYPGFLRSTNLESKLIDFFVLLKF